MAGLKDLLARAQAATGGMRGGGGMPPPPPGEDPAMAEEPPMPMDEMTADEGAMPPMPEEMGPGDLDSVLAGIEPAIADLSPEAQEEIRSHINAIRDIAAGGEEAAEPPMPEGEMPPEEPVQEPPTPKSSESQLK